MIASVASTIRTSTEHCDLDEVFAEWATLIAAQLAKTT